MRFLPCLLLAVSAAAVPIASGQTPVAEKPEFRQLVPEGAAVEKIADGFKFTEGPAWNPKEGFLIFSDIPNNRLNRYDAKSGKAEAFRDPSNHANGNFYDSAASLYTCEHDTRRVSVQHPGGPVEVLVDHFEGKLFNSPNDIVVKNDGTVWFTDPTYGLGKRPSEQAHTRVYCFEPKTHELHAVTEECEQPNGLCFSPDEKRLYVADSGKARNVHVFDVGPDNQLSNGRVFCAIDEGVADGMRCDRHGNLFSTAGKGVQVFNPAGERIGMIPVPETPANLCFGGADWNELYITGRTSLYHIKLTTAAAGK